MSFVRLLPRNEFHPLGEIHFREKQRIVMSFAPAIDQRGVV